MAAPGSDSGRACGLPRKRRRRSAVSANKRWRRSVMAAHGHTRPFRALRLRLLSWSKPTCAAVSTPPGSSSFGLTPDKEPPPGREADVCGMSAKMGEAGRSPGELQDNGKKIKYEGAPGRALPGLAGLAATIACRVRVGHPCQCRRRGAWHAALRKGVAFLRRRRRIYVSRCAAQASRCFTSRRRRCRIGSV
jgi:hypothetical protein